MPRTRSLAWSELKIGVVTIAAIVIAVMTIFLLTGARGFAWQRHTLKTRFTNIAGLKPGSPVRVAGIEVGQVIKVELSGEQVDVTFEVNENVKDRITTQSVATLGSISLLGESAVDVTPSGQGTPIPEFGLVPPGPAVAQLADLTDRAGQGIEAITEVLNNMRAGKGTVGKLMTDEQLYVELQRFVTSASSLTDDIQHGRGSVGRLLTDPGAAQALEASLRHVEEVTRRINAGEGSLGALMKDDAFSRSLTSATNHLDTLAARINRGEGTAGKLINDSALYDRLDAVTTKLDQLMGSLNNGEGTAGQLLKDKQLYENMNKTATEASGLIAELKGFFAEVKKDPKRYLKVNIGIVNW